VIRLAVMMYVRYPLSLRNVEDLLAERGIDICHETVRLWWNRFGPMFAAEMWRAVDHAGEVLEVVATRQRDRKAALRFLKSAAESHRNRPDAVVWGGAEGHRQSRTAGMRRSLDQQPG
jgi:putative transposase